MSKRDYGEGSIYQRKDGRWVAAISLGWQGAKRLRKTHYAKTKREAQRWLRQAQRLIEDGREFPDERLTISTLLDLWLAAVKTDRETRPATYAAYETLARRHIRPQLGQVLAHKLRLLDVEHFLSARSAAGLSDQSVRNIHAALKTALGWAVRREMLLRNVATLLVSSEIKPHASQVLTLEQARAFQQALRGHRFEAPLIVGLSLGLRIGEIRGLRWRDVHFDTREVEVNSQVGYVRTSGWGRGPTKSGETRTLPLPSIAIAALEAHQQRQQELRQAAGEWRTDEGLVFTMEDGAVLQQRTVQRALDLLLAKIALPRLRLHDLRHSCGTLLLAQGVPLKVISEILGHADMAITEKLYVQVLPSVSRDAADRLDRALLPRDVAS